MNLKPAHTPSPWEIGLLGYLRGPNNENILENPANAAYIVRAVNAHEELVDLVKQALEQGNMPIEWDRLAEEVMARVEGGK